RSKRDWSSDVCSSDLEAKALNELFAEQGIELTPEVRTSYKALNHHLWREFEKGNMTREEVTGNRFGLLFQQFGKTVDSAAMEKQIGRASCRERGKKWG